MVILIARGWVPPSPRRGRFLLGGALSRDFGAGRILGGAGAVQLMPPGLSQAVNGRATHSRSTPLPSLAIAWEHLYFATLTLARSTAPLEDRLAEAFSHHLFILDITDFGPALDARFQALHTGLNEVALRRALGRPTADLPLGDLVREVVGLYDEVTRLHAYSNTALHVRQQARVHAAGVWQAGAPPLVG